MRTSLFCLMTIALIGCGGKPPSTEPAPVAGSTEKPASLVKKGRLNADLIKRELWGASADEVRKKLGIPDHVDAGGATYESAHNAHWVYNNPPEKGISILFQDGKVIQVEGY